MSQTPDHEGPILEIDSLSISFFTRLREIPAVMDFSVEVQPGEAVGLVGESGCGKSTVLRCFNRMNDLIDIARVEGTVLYRDIDLYDPEVDPVAVRRRIGMVFQKPNPFPKSIYDNVAFGPRVAGLKGNLDDLVEIDGPVG